jgi:hypothetical protein
MDGTSPVSDDLDIHSPFPYSSHLIDPSASSRWKEILDTTSFFHDNVDREGTRNFSIHLQFHKVSQPKVPHPHTGYSKNLSCVLIFVRTHFVYWHCNQILLSAPSVTKALVIRLHSEERRIRFPLFKDIFEFHWKQQSECQIQQFKTPL